MNLKNREKPVWDCRKHGMKAGGKCCKKATFIGTRVIKLMGRIEALVVALTELTSGRPADG